MDNEMTRESLWDIFEDSVRKNKERVAVWYSYQSYTYGQYYEDICDIASRIAAEADFTQNTPIVIYAENSYLYACYVMACVRLGITAVPLNTKMDLRDLERIVKETGAKCVYTDREDMVDHKVYRLIAKGDSAIFLDDKIQNDSIDVQFILFSSGSTGEIKGIECTQSGIIAATYSINEVIGNCCDDNILCILDFSFDYGLYQLLLAYEVGAAVTIYSSNDNILRIPEYIFKNGVTGFPATPFLMKILKETKKASADKLSSLRYISSTGDHLSLELIDYYRDILPRTKIFPMYGLTECKRVSILAPEDYEKHKGSVGKPISCCTVKIIKEDGTEAKCGEEGELVVIGSNVMKGYFGDEKLTREKYVQRDDGTIELHSGDIFTMDEEGFLYFISRTQHYIKIREKRVSPLSIEREIREKCDKITDCLIVPLRETSKEDSVFCFLRLKEGNSVDGAISDINGRLTRLYLPKYYSVFNEMFPHNSNGKIDRKKMTETAKELFDRGLVLKK